MCQEQVGLTSNFQTFVDKIKTAFAIDPRIAVTTVDAQCALSDTVFSARGKFNQHAARTFGVNCQVSMRKPCTTAADCGDPAAWTCEGYDDERPNCNVNPNGSANTDCKPKCADDATCEALFDDAAYTCSSVSGTIGCLPTPGSIDCPDALPEFLTGDNIDLFPCIATVGVQDGRCLWYEQPLNAGYMALDPGGEQAEQAKRFLREDAYLVIIFVTDEEDCSVATPNAISSENRARCSLAGTTDEGGPLVPVAHFVNRFRGLKDDPGRVIVAAIAGDSTATGPQQEVDRQAYRESKESPATCHLETTICNGPTGVADFSSRLVELTASFGPNGTFTNICDGDGIELALGRIADNIVSIVNKVCLPRPMDSGLVVERTRGGVTSPLAEGDGPNTYRVIEQAEECARDGQLLPAIAFYDPPVPGESIAVRYEGDAQFE